MRAREEWIPFNVPKIIEDYSLYEKIQKILDFNQKYACKKRRYDYLLSGLVYCECGERRSGDGTSKYGHFYYRCIERMKNRIGDRRCDSPGVNAAVLDGMLWNELKKRLNNYSQIKKYTEKWVKSLFTIGREDEIEQNRLNELIGKIAEEETRYAKAYGVGSLEFEQFQELAKDTKKRKLNYQKQLVKLASRNKELEINIEVDELTAEAIRVIKEIDFSDKFKVVRDIIDKVIIGERSGVQVCAHLPLQINTAEKEGYEPKGRDSGSPKCG